MRIRHCAKRRKGEEDCCGRDGQLRSVGGYRTFLSGLENVWRECH